MWFKAISFLPYPLLWTFLVSKSKYVITTFKLSYEVYFKHGSIPVGSVPMSVNATKCQYQLGGGSSSIQLWTGLQWWPLDVSSRRWGQGVPCPMSRGDWGPVQWGPMHHGSWVMVTCGSPPVDRLTDGVFTLAVSGTGTRTRTWTRKNGLYGLKKNLSHCTWIRTEAWAGTRKNGLCTYFSGPETVSGSVFQLYCNGFQVSSSGHRHSQCEWFLHNISPGPCPGPRDSQCEYTITDGQTQLKNSEVIALWDELGYEFGPYFNTHIYKEDVIYRASCFAETSMVHWGFT